jgi:hypothetical protein
MGMGLVASGEAVEPVTSHCARIFPELSWRRDLFQDPGFRLEADYSQALRLAIVVDG